MGSSLTAPPSAAAAPPTAGDGGGKGRSPLLYLLYESLQRHPEPVCCANERLRGLSYFSPCCGVQLRACLLAHGRPAPEKKGGGVESEGEVP
eukprot:CAMPEP_0119483750 /NCGR_PEP_ID=MMETSP1344-20130328/11012_1 /TAXON_ID=236787 /ORGANISM="Florenciella parvula, Strain CCMP2471" /LENGTH=91 /DNA_ID=CAMNT_0007518265 /DNA_START=1241 /DNA_END=1516 /DNA_ORIENTATION=-